jgi:hypothetical protein
LKLVEVILLVAPELVPTVIVRTVPGAKVSVPLTAPPLPPPPPTRRYSTVVV